jgi:CubicO group peptidase (beta-lactamase class C family)
MLKPALVALVTGLLALPALSQPATPDLSTQQGVNELLQDVIARHKMPGVVALVWKDGQVIASGAAGVRHAKKPEPLLLDDAMHIGSCNKAITSTLAAVLVKQGKLSWDATVEQTLPDLATKLDPSWRTITLKQALSHSAGLPDNPPMGDLLKLRLMNNQPSAARTKLLTDLGAKPLPNPPGQFLYSNVGYVVAAQMIEAVTATTYEEALQDQIFKPLGITTAGFGPPAAVWGHAPNGTPIAPGPAADNLAAYAPAGTVHMSLPDWMKFIAIHLKPERAAVLGLTKEDTTTLHTPVVQPDAKNAPNDGYALGWMTTTRPWATGQVLTHAGSNTVFFAVAWLSPDDDLAVLVATNIAPNRGAPGTDEIAARLLLSTRKPTTRAGQ